MKLFGVNLKRGDLVLLIFSLAYMIGFGIYFFLTSNHEFLMYDGFIFFISVIIFLTINKTKFSKSVLWPLSLVIFLHFCGGGIFINGNSLYKWQMFHIIGSGDSYVLRFDQFMHFWGIFIMTLLAYHLLTVYFKEKNNFIYFATFFMGIGWGCMVELGEFTGVILFKYTGVGGYFNNALDLFFNALGALAASISLYVKNKKSLE